MGVSIENGSLSRRDVQPERVRVRVNKRGGLRRVKKRGPEHLFPVLSFVLVSI